MKLAEALIEKKDITARIGELQNRYTAAAVIEEGAQRRHDQYAMNQLLLQKNLDGRQ